MSTVHDDSAERVTNPASLWHDDPSLKPFRSKPLGGNIDVDVAIVGAGYTGLWTAYFLLKSNPTLTVALFESKTVGFGASGRNGGWCSALFPASMKKIASLSSRDEAVRLQRTMNASIAEMGDIVRAEKIDCEWKQGGYVSLARNEAQLVRSRNEIAGWKSWGFGAEHMELLTAAEASKRANASNVVGGTYTPNCAAIHPAKLVSDLARVVEKLGATIYEQTTVTRIGDRRLETDRGAVRADVIVRATEGYTAEFPQFHRAIVPMYSLMVATEPLPKATWDAIGLAEHETFSDKRHLRIYGQRTSDGRFAFGGRGAPYHFGSTVSPAFDLDPRVHNMLRGILRELFPVIGDAQFTHAWGGNLGIPRDWYPSVTFDRKTGFGQAGGYVGDGVSTAFVAGKTLAADILDLESDLRTLPWVGRHSPNWEIEPLRWLGVNAVTQAFAKADRDEARTGRPSGIAKTVWTFIGH
jgi:glycine/D-amino acid oxidase-like deaminating enzyme